MKKTLTFACLVLSLLFSAVTPGFAKQTVAVAVAMRSAEFHAEMIFKKELRVCDRETLYWPWGEPAAHVFTLAGADVDAPRDILSDPTLLRGARLVASGREEEGYRTMAQAERFVTVFVGATTDMPSMIKAHAGLPEHVIYLALRPAAEPEPRWIYDGPFQILAATSGPSPSKRDGAVEIHTGRETTLEDRPEVRVGALPAVAEGLEWGPFLSAGGARVVVRNPYLRGLTGVEEGEHALDVQELNTKGSWQGCAPAAVYNCLRYLESNGLVDTEGAGVNTLLDWIAICLQTTPATGSTLVSNVAPGAAQLFRGLGWYSTCAQVLYDNQPLPFLETFAAEIAGDTPCEMGGTGQGIFVGHSVTGIGYLKQGELCQIIVHDGWASTPEPVYVKYLGYPVADLAWPYNMNTFHPGQEGTFKKALPKVLGSKELKFNASKGKWTGTMIFSSLNDVRVRAYAESLKCYDLKGALYYTSKKPRRYEVQQKQGWRVPLSFNWPEAKPGRIEMMISIVDDNGYLHKSAHTVKLLEPVVDKWDMEVSWSGQSPYPTEWDLKANHTFTATSGAYGTWSLNGKKIKVVYKVPWYPVYLGTVNTACTKMNGTVSMKDPGGHLISGTWKAVRHGFEDLLPGAGADTSPPRDSGAVRR